MDTSALVDVLQEVGRRLSADPDGYRQLVFSHKDRRGRTAAGEPDLRYLLTSVLSERGVKFGLERPTKKKYRYRGRREADRGNTDVTVDPSGPAEVDVELKAKAKASYGEFHQFAEDLMKLLGEPVPGAAMVHLSEKGKTERVLRGYAQAYAEASRLMRDTVDIEGKWFLFFVIDRRVPECVWRTWDDVRVMQADDFARGPFERMRLRGGVTH